MMHIGKHLCPVMLLRTLQALQRKIRDAENRRRPEPELPRMAMRPMGAMMGAPMGPMMGKGMPMAPKGGAQWP